MIVHFYDKHMTPIGTSRGNVEIIYKSKFDSPDTATLTGYVDGHIEKLLQPGNIIRLDNSLRLSLIQNVVMEGSRGAIKITAYAEGLSIIWDYRVWYLKHPVPTGKKNALEMLENFKNYNFTHGFLTSRRVRFMGDIVMPEGEEDSIIMHYMSNQYRKSGLDLVQHVAELNDIGFAMELGDRQEDGSYKANLVFRRGKDITEGQTQNRPVIFSTESGLLSMERYIDDRSEERNFVYIAGEGRGEHREVAYIDNAGEGRTGIDHREVVIDARDVQRDEDETDSNYRERLRREGKRRAEELRHFHTISHKVENSQFFKYGEDYNIGDIVTIKDTNLDLQIDLAVTEVEEIYEKKGNEVYVYFGEPERNVLEYIETKIKIGNL